jgi:hypothetical protein
MKFALKRADFLRTLQAFFYQLIDSKGDFSVTFNIYSFSAEFKFLEICRSIGYGNMGSFFFLQRY